MTFYENSFLESKAKITLEIPVASITKGRIHNGLKVNAMVAPSAIGIPDIASKVVMIT